MRARLMRQETVDHRRNRLPADDVREMLRLCNELHTATDEGDARKLKLLEGLRRLTDADTASATVVAVPRLGDKPGVVSSVSLGARRTQGTNHEVPWDAYRREHSRRRRRKRAAHDNGNSSPDWCTTAVCERGRPASRRVDHCVHSFLPLADGDVVACVTVRREAGRRQFSTRDRAIVCTLHGQAGWIYRPDVMLASPETRMLSRRERETLQYLLAGKGEKQIAAAMGRSFNTIHHYVKALHRHFRVSSRSELLSRWVGR